MSKKPLFLSILVIIALVIWMNPANAQAIIDSISPNAISAGDILTISGRDFGTKKGNIYIGATKYPYYGHSIANWTDNQIVLELDQNDTVPSGRLGVQAWVEDGSHLDAIVYGLELSVEPSVDRLSSDSVSVDSSFTIFGSSFESAGNTEPKVYINNKQLEVVYWNDKIIKVEVPVETDSGSLKIVFADGFVVNGDYITIKNKISNQSSLSSQWYLSAINAKAAQDKYLGSDSVVVAVVDDGVYLGHPDLSDNIWINQGEIEGNGRDDDNNGYVDDRWGWNFAYNTQDMTTSGTHGTMVAGIIGAYSQDSDLARGIARNISLMPIIVSDESGNIFAGDINKAIYYAVDNGADIINLSLGGSVYYYSSQFDEAIKYAYKNNVLIVAAAGNGDTEGSIGRDLDITKISPVCNDNGQNMILGVGASDKNNQATNWTNYGSCVDIYAPGVDISSTAVPYYTGSGLFYQSASGTSFATPMVSGAAALIKAQYPQISNQAIVDRIVKNSTYTNGIKLLNVYEAVAQVWSSDEKITQIVKTPVVQTTSLDKNAKYISQQKSLLGNIDKNLSQRLSGQILLQVEDHGEAWYIFPDNHKRYYLGTATDAYDIMRKLGLGATHEFIHSHTIFPDYVAGKILLDVEANGEAYYISPVDHKAYYMKDGADAYHIMRSLGLGISNLDIRKINIGEIQ